MNKEPPKSLIDNIASPRKYNNGQNSEQSLPEQQAPIDYKKLKDKLEEFRKKVVKKFPFIKAIGILPAYSSPLFEEDEAIPKEVVDSKPIQLIMLIPEDQYKNLAKIKPEIIEYAKETGENIWVHIKTSEVDLWNYGLDSKFEFIDAIATSYPLHDNGFLGALRVATIHKNLVLNWLNTGRAKYVATYAIGGSLVRGTADKTSDVDTFVIIDDTDVKRMSRIELLEKLRGRIVLDFLKEATALAGVKNILNVQVYLLTDFWQSVKDAQPVMFTFIRDGVPLYDRGTFIPWKRLLQMGRIKPSPEAIDLYMKEGDRTEEIVKRRLIDAMVDIYFGVVTPTQAMMMLAGHAPPVPKTIVAEVKEVLVDKEKVMTLKELKTLEKVVKLYKDYEHGKLKEVPGKEIDTLVQESKDYAKFMKELRTKLEKKMQQHEAEKIYNETFSLMKNLFGDKSSEALIKDFEKNLVKQGKVPERLLAVAKQIEKLKKKMSDKPLSQIEVQKIIHNAADLMNSLMEYAQRKELMTAEKGLLQISYNGKNAELLLTEKGGFLVEEGKIKKIENNKITESSKEELEKEIEGVKTFKPKVTTETLEVLRHTLGNFTIIL
ncbi:MAG: nucleotidyltransferase domain-containing protein [Nanoarchaeota archaeon]|nr:nucleotidyltransferase domain-containing protein [Nanoarchaeota archaeon]